MPGNALDNAQACSPVTYVLNGRGSYCETEDDHPQTYTTLQGDYLYYLKKNKDLHGIWTIPADLGDQERADPDRQAGVDLGIKKDGDGFYEIFSRDPQSAMTPDRAGHQAEQLELRVQRRQQDGSTCARRPRSRASPR